MRLIRHYKFGPVHGYKVGWSAVGSPVMSTFFYIHYTHMIDTGLSHMRREILEIASSHELQKILLTHHHEDHSGNAASISKKLDIPVFGHEQAAHKMKTPYKILPYQHYMWGKTTPLLMKTVPAVVEGKHVRLIPVETPGHSRDHLAYHDAENGILFSGDLYLADEIKFFRSDEMISDLTK